jgi:hypothetical protein
MAAGLTPTAELVLLTPQPDNQRGERRQRLLHVPITPEVNSQMSLTRLELDELRSATGIREWAIYSSLDTFGSPLATFAVQTTRILERTKGESQCRICRSFQQLFPSAFLGIRQKGSGPVLGASTMSSCRGRSLWSQNPSITPCSEQSEFSQFRPDVHSGVHAAPVPEDGFSIR